MNNRLERAMERFSSKLKDKTIEEADAIVLDEVCRMSSHQLAAAYIFIEGLTTTERRNILATNFDIY